jgi:hypothetical protein
MALRIAASVQFRQALFLAGCIALVSFSTAQAGKKGYITKLTVDPDAPKVGLFAGMEDGSLDVKLVPKDAQGGNLLIENKTDGPLSVEMPAGFVGVPVMAQITGGGLGGGGLGGGVGGGGGQQQSVGGGSGGGLGGGGGGLGGGGLGGGGGGFFSIPPEKTVLVPYGSVCLEYGKAEPRPRSNYKIIPIEEYTEDPTLQEFIALVGTGRIHPEIAQPAAWHIANKMSWQELASLKYDRIGVPDTAHFSDAQLFKAQELVGMAVGKAKERAEAAPTEEPARTSRVSRVR